MRVSILVLGAVLGLASAAMALPIGPLPAAPNVSRIHGCHHSYAQDMSGWHRHDSRCRTLRGTVGRKSRNPQRS
jgi:hypothetical protein